ncbi:MAG: ATP-binding cassette domain-containing protein [Actinomycetota bacterium]
MTATATVVGRHRTALVVQAVLALVAGVCEAVAIVVITRLAVSATGSEDVVELRDGWTIGVGPAGALAAGLVVTALALGLAAAWIGASRYAQELGRGRAEVTEAFFGSDWAIVEEERQGDLQTLVTTHAERTANVLDAVSTMVVAGGNLVVLVVLALVVSPLAALAATTAGGALIFVARPFTRATRRYSQRLATQERELGVLTTEAGSLALEARTSGVERSLLDRLRAAYGDAERSALLGRFVSRLTGPVYQASALLLIVVGATLVALGDAADTEAVGAALLLLLRSFSYARRAQLAHQTYLQGQPYLDQLHDRIADLRARPAPTGDRAIEVPAPFELDGVDFAYEHGDPVLTDVQLHIAPGEILGLTGASGAGKSTLVHLLLGLRAPTGGTVRLGDVDLSSADRSSLHRAVAYVPQEPRLLDGTVADNVRLFRDLDDSTVRDALRAAHLDEELADGGAAVGPGGSLLSGGQRQRLTIARALAGDPAVLILDEPTSALDDASDHAIRSTLAELRGRVTVVVISHRSSTLQVCDRVGRLVDGRLDLV